METYNEKIGENAGKGFFIFTMIIIIISFIVDPLQYITISRNYFKLQMNIFYFLANVWFLGLLITIISSYFLSKNKNE